MITIKKYFLYALLCTILPIHAMDNNSQDDYVKYIGGTIDGSLLGVKPTTYYTSFLGTLMSYWKTTWLSAPQAQREIERIEEYIPSKINAKDCKEIFTKLMKKHWYVYYVTQILIQEKIKEFENVTGSTIDDLYKPNFTTDKTGRKEIVHQQACNEFFAKSNINAPLENVPFSRHGDIHMTILYGHTHPIKPDSLIMSADGKYLQSKDCNDNILTWYMKKGTQVDVSDDPNPIIWHPGSTSTPGHIFYTTDKYNNYCAISANAKMKEIMNIDSNESAIFLYQRPTKVSLLCQHAIENKYGDTSEMRALQQSNTLHAIEGFSKDNLQKLLTGLSQ